MRKKPKDSTQSCKEAKEKRKMFFASSLLCSFAISFFYAFEMMYDPIAHVIEHADCPRRTVGADRISCQRCAGPCPHSDCECSVWHRRRAGCVRVGTAPAGTHFRAGGRRRAGFIIYP